ncbi:hypothetical protein PF011_g7589 [Phytophthora fragariae]|uniref:Uncharacterized protein n=1 Tax=Phytophthora fragariae TaxID=53985 RepID=A0A6A3LB29_9STRA|nr:hypothetical protein PF011_g7589 [Phytophthora fragariae]
MAAVWPNSIGDCVASGVSCASKLRVCVASLLLLSHGGRLAEQHRRLRRLRRQLRVEAPSLRGLVAAAAEPGRVLRLRDLCVLISALLCAMAGALTN